MPTYIALMNWTDQGAKTADQTVTRYDAAKDDLAQLGVTIKDIYWTMGPYDLVTVVEAADDETATKGLMRLASQGNLRTCSMRAFHRRRGAKPGRLGAPPLAGDSLHPWRCSRRQRGGSLRPARAPSQKPSEIATLVLDATASTTAPLTPGVRG